MAKLTDTNLISGWGYAEECARRLHTSYWAETEGRVGYHLEEAHKAFKQLASNLGYTVTKKEDADV